MNYDLTQRVFKPIYETELVELRDGLFRSAIHYARLRAEWMIASAEERINMDESRKLAHNAFIDACNILSRNMAKQGENNSWRRLLGEDRKEIGDFACYLHCILGVLAR